MQIQLVLSVTRIITQRRPRVALPTCTGSLEMSGMQKPELDRRVLLQGLL